MPTPFDREQEQRDAALAIPFNVRYLAGWSWRLIVICLVLYGLVHVLTYVPFLWIPVVIAGLLAGLLFPAVDWLESKHIPRALGSAVILVLVLVGIVLVFFFVIEGLVTQFPVIWQQLEAGWNTILTGIEQFPIPASWSIENMLERISNTVIANFNSLSSSVWRVGSGTTVGLTYVALAMFATYFFMVEGDKFWRDIISLMPKRHHEYLDKAGREGWKGVIAFSRFQGVVAAIEGVYIWIIAILLHVPLAFPLGILVFVGAFVPVLGAVSTGVVAIILAVSTGGISNGVFMLVAVLVINQLESWLLQPIIMGPATNMHPMVIIFTVVGGATIGGILGALIGVPLMAFLFGAVRYSRSLSEDEPDELANKD